MNLTSIMHVVIRSYYSEPPSIKRHSWRRTLRTIQRHILYSTYTVPLYVKLGKANALPLRCVDFRVSLVLTEEKGVSQIPCRFSRASAAAARMALLTHRLSTMLIQHVRKFRR